MLLDLNTLVERHQLQVHGVIHVGAHLAEEAPAYAGLGIEHVIWVEANPDVIDRVRAAVHPYNGIVLQALITDEVSDGPLAFNVTNYDGMSSSVFRWGTHTAFSPDTVVERTIYLPTTTLNHLLRPCASLHNYNMLNIDVEGAGLLVLQGAEELIPRIDYIYIEVQTENVYDGAPMLDEYSAFLGDRGFRLADLGMVEGQGWGDAFYVRAKHAPV